GDGARAFAALTGLRRLELARSGVTDLSPFMLMTKLEYLDCCGCRSAPPVAAIWTLPSLGELILYDALLPGSPARVLSPNPHRSSVESLRAHLAGLEAPATSLRS